ncbi:MAG TPA: hypothetical protein VJU78_07920 [Chitinophagaceae bacterium]|nr:hypothetical protein [Chitinophagaceae bacterium]
MEEQEEKFSWTLLFFVTAVSFFVFSALTRLFNGFPSHYSLFFKIGVGAILLAVLTFCIPVFSETARANKKTVGPH